MAKPFLLACTALLLSGGWSPSDSAENSLPTAAPKQVIALDYGALPSDAEIHHRTKWSNGLFLYIDDDAAAPSIYTFDKSGHMRSEFMIQIPDADRIRIYDFAAAPDGSIWGCGRAVSRTGQEGFFLAHVEAGGGEVHIIQTAFYWPRQLSVAPDGTVWIIGHGLTPPDSKGNFTSDKSQDVLRHFDASGKQLGSAVALSTVGPARVLSGFLVASQDRLGWYAPVTRAGAYVEFSPDMKVLHTYPSVPGADKHSLIYGIALTPSGQVFAVLLHQPGDGLRSALYRLDRNANDWVRVEAPPRDSDGDVPRLEGNDGESLIFTGPPDKSKLRIFDVSEVIGYH